MNCPRCNRAPSDHIVCACNGLEVPYKNTHIDREGKGDRSHAGPAVPRTRSERRFANEDAALTRRVVAAMARREAEKRAASAAQPAGG